MNLNQIKKLFRLSIKPNVVFHFAFNLIKVAILSAFIALVIYPNFLNLEFTRHLLTSTNINQLTGLALLLLFFILLVWRRQNKFWWKYKNSYKIESPKFIYPDFIFCTIYFTGLLILIYPVAHPTISGEVNLFLQSIGLLIITYFLTSYFSPFRSFKSIPVRRSENDISDEPIRFPDEDLLNRGIFVRGLYDEVKQLSLSDSFVFGLYGDWGEGKTSVLNLFKSLISNDKDFILVNFEPWNFKDEEAMLNAFFNILERALSEKYIFPNLKKLFIKYQQVISSGISNAGLKLDFGLKEETVDEIRRRIEQYIESTGKKLLIIVDEIDRLQPDEILMIFKLVRSNSKFRNSIFILSLDEGRTTGKLGEDGKEYLKKIIQKPNSLPKIEQTFLNNFVLFSEHRIPQYRISELQNIDSDSLVTTSGFISVIGDNTVTVNELSDGSGEEMNINFPSEQPKAIPSFNIGDRIFIEGRLDNNSIYLDSAGSRVAKFKLSRIDLLFERLWNERKTTLEQIAYFDKEFVYLYRTSVSKLIQNFRDAKSFLNSLYSSLPAIVEEVNIFDFTLLEILKVFAKELYDDIFDNWWYYVDERFEGDAFNNPFIGLLSRDEGKKEDAIKKHIQQFFDNHKYESNKQQALRAILEALFPNLSRVTSVSEDDRRNKRIFTTSFLKYFTLSVTSTELSDTFFESVLENWKKNPKPSVVKDKLFELQQKGKLKEFLDKLRRVYSESLSKPVIDILVKTIYRNSKKLSRENTEDFWNSEYDKGLVLILKILNSKVEVSAIQGKIEEIIKKTPDLRLAVELVLTIKEERGGDLYTIYKSIDHPKLRKILSARLERYFITGKRNIFKEVSLRKEWAAILYQWGSDWSNTPSPHRTKVTRYITTLLKSNPAEFVEFLGVFNAAFPGEDWKMNTKEAERAYDLKLLRELATKFNGDRRLTWEQRIILKKFINASQESNPNSELEIE